MRQYSLADIESRLTPSHRMPVLFVGHGNPMNALRDNPFTRTWSNVGQGLPTPQAIVVISAHWLTPGSTHITDAPRNRVIYDFGGFPDELFAVPYPSEGDPLVARALQRQFLEYETQLDAQWGLDHGTWSVLVHMAPEPTVPILQISIDYGLPLEELHALFGRLRGLRDRGVLFIGSGNVVHSLARARWEPGAAAWDWAVEFDRVTAEAMDHGRIDQLVDPFATWDTARLAVPTDDHYRPMIAAMALLHPAESLSFFNEGIDMGAIGMRSFITAA